MVVIFRVLSAIPLLTELKSKFHRFLHRKKEENRGGNEEGQKLTCKKKIFMNFFCEIRVHGCIFTPDYFHGLYKYV